jgi:hypothetical protein
MNPNTLTTTQTVAFDQSTATDHNIHDPGTGRRFICTKIFLYFDASNTVRFESGTTNLSGLMTFQAGDFLELGDGEKPVMIGDALGDIFILRVDVAAQVSGFFSIVEITE